VNVLGRRTYNGTNTSTHGSTMAHLYSNLNIHMESILNNITIKHEGVNYHLEQFLWAWKKDLEVNVNLYSFSHQMEMLSEVRRILKEHFGKTSWDKQEVVKELMTKDML